MMREWIIFALCLGVGGHIALGVVMHAPGLWPWSTTGFYGLLSGLAVYGLVQAGRGFGNCSGTLPSSHRRTDPTPHGEQCEHPEAGLSALTPTRLICVELLYVRPPA